MNGSRIHRRASSSTEAREPALTTRRATARGATARRSGSAVAAWAFGRMTPPLTAPPVPSAACRSSERAPSQSSPNPAPASARHETHWQIRRQLVSVSDTRELGTPGCG